MPHVETLALGIAGLVLADLDDLRIYRAGVLDPLGAPDTALAPIGSGLNYTLSGLPDPADSTERVTATASIQGTGWAAAWGGPGGSPAYVILPIRTAGLLPADVSLEVFVDGALSPFTLLWQEVGADVGGGDYLVRQWPTTRAAQTGRRWFVAWMVDGLALSTDWRELPAVATSASVILTPARVVTLPRGTTLPGLKLLVTFAEDPEGASAVFYLAASGTTATLIDGAPAVLNIDSGSPDPPTGSLEYSWTPEDTAEANSGRYFGRFVVTYASTGTQGFPSEPIAVRLT